MFSLLIAPVVIGTVIAATVQVCSDEPNVAVTTFLIECPLVLSANVTSPTTWTVNNDITVTIPSATNLVLTTASTETILKTVTLYVASSYPFI